MGAFCKRNDTLICGGHTVWQGQNTVITMWGDDDQTMMKIGFAEGALITFKVWDSRGGKVFNATGLHVLTAGR